MDVSADKDAPRAQLLDLGQTLKTLAGKRPVFHSEADFQHEFAMVLKAQYPSAALRLEVPFKFEKRGSTDIIVRLGTHIVGIELKYLKKIVDFEWLGERFSLKNDGATDLRRYDILKDVCRLERFNAEFGGPSYVIAVTNDPAYWNPVNRDDTIDANFRLCDGRTVAGDLAWSTRASAGTIKGREDILSLSKPYNIIWQDFSKLDTKNGNFRVLVIEVS